MHEFEWDEVKRKQNIEKHALDFIRAVDVFFDPNRIELETVSRTERRYQTIGMVNDIVIFLVYTFRGEKKRIISARRASKDERKTYQST